MWRLTSTGFFLRYLFMQYSIWQNFTKYSYKCLEASLEVSCLKGKTYCEEILVLSAMVKLAKAIWQSTKTHSFVSIYCWAQHKNIADDLSKLVAEQIANWEKVQMFLTLQLGELARFCFSNEVHEELLLWATKYEYP